MSHYNLISLLFMLLMICVLLNIYVSCRVGVTVVKYGMR